MTGVSIDVLSIYSDLKTHNLLRSVEHILWSQNYAEERGTRKCRRGTSSYLLQNMFFNVSLRWHFKTKMKMNISLTIYFTSSFS